MGRTRPCGGPPGGVRGGYRLFSGKPEPPRKAARPALTPRMTPVEALQRVAATCIGQIQANGAGFLQVEDPKYLHQLRVGWRRLRSALSMLRDPVWKESLGPLRPDLRWVSRSLNAARNWDVFAVEILPSVLAGRHQVRIEAKKLRYTSEFFASLFGGKRAKRYAARLADLQEVLGAVNDAANGAEMIAEAAHSGREPLHGNTVDLAAASLAAVEAEKLSRLRKSWVRFSRQKPFWNRARASGHSRSRNSKEGAALLEIWRFHDRNNVEIIAA